MRHLWTLVIEKMPFALYDLGPQIKSLIKYTNAVINGSYNNPLLENFKLEPDNPKTGKIDQVFDKNTHVIVQVLKEPISTKRPTFKL